MSQATDLPLVYPQKIMRRPKFFQPPPINTTGEDHAVLDALFVLYQYIGQKDGRELFFLPFLREEPSDEPATEVESAKLKEWFETEKPEIYISDDFHSSHPFGWHMRDEKRANSIYLYSGLVRAAEKARLTNERYPVYIFALCVTIAHEFAHYAVTKAFGVDTITPMHLRLNDDDIPHSGFYLEKTIFSGRVVFLTPKGLENRWTFLQAGVQIDKDGHEAWKISRSEIEEFIEGALKLPYKPTTEDKLQKNARVTLSRNTIEEETDLQSVAY